MLLGLLHRLRSCKQLDIDDGNGLRARVVLLHARVAARNSHA